MPTDYWPLVEPIWEAVSIYDGPDVFLSQFNAAQPTPRTLFAAHWAYNEICNGGLHQFFSNSTGVLAPEAVTAFRRIGMPKIAAIIADATSWFGPQYPRERHERQKCLAPYEMDHPKAWSPFERQDNQFFDLIESENGGFLAAANEFAASNSS